MSRPTVAETAGEVRGSQAVGHRRWFPPALVGEILRQDGVAGSDRSVLCVLVVSLLLQRLLSLHLRLQVWSHAVE
jgi:hypothetical protein